MSVLHKSSVLFHIFHDHIFIIFIIAIYSNLIGLVLWRTFRQSIFVDIFLKYTDCGKVCIIFLNRAPFTFQLYLFSLALIGV